MTTQPAGLASPACFAFPSTLPAMWVTAALAREEQIPDTGQEEKS